MSLPNAQSVKSQFDHEPNVELPLEGKKQLQEKSTLPIVESGNLTMPGTKFPSEVSQSRLLEIVLKNNKLMQLMHSKQSKEAQPVKSFQVADSQSVVTDGGISREGSGSSKRLRSVGSTDVADTTGRTCTYNHQDGYRAVCSTQHAGQTVSIKDINSLDNLAKNKMWSLQTNSNASVNTPQLSVLSTCSTRNQDDNAIQAQLQSQNADLVHADASSRSKIQIASGTHFNPQKNEPQIRTSSSVSQYMQQQMFLDISSYIQSQMSQFNSQRSSMSAQTIPHSHEGQVIESHVSEKLATFNKAQSSGENESPQSHLQPLKGKILEQPLLTARNTIACPPAIKCSFSALTQEITHKRSLALSVNAAFTLQNAKFWSHESDFVVAALLLSYHGIGYTVPQMYSLAAILKKWRIRSPERTANSS